MKANMMPGEVTREIKYTKVLVFGVVQTYYDINGHRSFLFGPTKAGLKVAGIAASHVASGHQVYYREYRDPFDTSDYRKHNVYADCIIRNPTA